MQNKLKAVSLMELIVALILLSVVTLGLAGISLFSHYHVVNSDRRAKVQNEASYLLDHMNKQVYFAIGNEAINGGNSVVDINNSVGGVSDTNAMRIYKDADVDGQRSAGDYWIAYLFKNYGATNYQIRYCSQCTSKACGTCANNWEVLSKRVANFIPVKPGGASLSGNYVDANFTACWNPGSAVSSDNPCLTLRSRFKMPSVPTN
jgi:Tfp pilus assembly protein PilW